MWEVRAGTLAVDLSTTCRLVGVKPPPVELLSLTLTPSQATMLNNEMPFVEYDRNLTRSPQRADRLLNGRIQDEPGRQSSLIHK